ncbi:MAG: hypothetical protein ABJA02_02855 [Acidobacteriota bacterium]
MFEESLYEQRPAAEPAPIGPDGDLFENYELKTWVPSSRLYKILGASALANVLVLLVFGQTSLLTAKGCDSPFVGSVCQVLDTVYLGSLLLGTQREYADAAYERTQLSDMDITYVELPSESSKLQYPEGYFELANPEQFVANQTTPGMDVPVPSNIPTYSGIPTTRPIPGNNLLNTPPLYAKPKKNVVNGKLPTDFGEDPTVSDFKPGLNKRKPGSNTPTNPPDKKPGEIAPGIPGNSNTNTGPNGQTTAQGEKPDEAVLDEHGVYINKRPTRDFATEALQKLENKQIVLDTPFKVTIKGTLGPAKDGKTIILKNPRPVITPTETAGDPAMLKFAQEAIIAFADAGWFGYLDKMEAKNVTIHLEQNNDVVIARLSADQPDENRAKAFASSLNTVLFGAALAAGDGDTKAFLQAAKTGTDGKTFFVNMEMPKPVFTQMIQRKLAEQKAEPKQSPQPSSNAMGVRSNSLAQN